MSGYQISDAFLRREYPLFQQYLPEIPWHSCKMVHDDGHGNYGDWLVVTYVGVVIRQNPKHIPQADLRIR